jgi:endonuclease YncB( thermonuclease family)
MKTTDALVRSLLLFFVAALAATSASAASLIGKVTEVHEGDLVTIMSLNKPVRIKLMGVDAPDADQPHFETARQHLSDLAYGKMVLVEYSGLVQSRYILGKMFVDQQDIGAQMIRDGVAWYDASGATRLTQQEREMYEAIEKLARGEHRGLWQDPSPTSPWAFRENLALKAKMAAPPPPKVKEDSAPKPPPSLTNDDLMLAVGGRGGSIRALDLVGEDSSDWKTLSPEGYSFKVRVPATSMERGIEMPSGTDKNIDYNVAIGNLNGTTYLVAYGRGPLLGRSPSGLLDELAGGFTNRMNEGLMHSGAKVSFNVVKDKDVALAGMTGMEYRLTTGQHKGILRVFTKANKGELRILMLGAINVQESDPQVGAFFRSLEFTKPKVEVAKKKVEGEETP